MKKLFSKIHFVLSIVLLIGLLVEFYFAGMGVFLAASFRIHQTTGIILWAASFLILLFSLIGRLGGKTIGFSILLFLLLFIQPLLLQSNQPFVKALHVINGLVVLASCFYLVTIGARRKL